MANRRMTSVDDMFEFFSTAFNYDPETEKEFLIRMLPENDERAEKILKNLWAIYREIREELDGRFHADAAKWPSDK